MSNFNAFNTDHIKKLLEPFAPGMAGHITPIEYEATSPDCFLFLFRTTAPDGNDHFFVSLETDYVSNLEGAECTVQDWHGSFDHFLPLASKTAAADPEELNDYTAETSGPYFAMLAKVERPTRKGYWADAITIAPGDKIADKLSHLNQKDQAAVRKALGSVLQHSADPSASFLESFQAKQQNTIVDDVNMTNIIASLYLQPNGEVEVFYNHAQPTVGGKPK